MNFEEAIKSLNYAEADFIGTEYAEAFPVAISALGKQIPKKPMHTPDNHNWFCPTCHNPIKLGRNHCCNCGQKIGYGSDTE